MVDLSNSKENGQQLEMNWFQCPSSVYSQKKKLEYFQHLSREIIPVKGKYAIHSDLKQCILPGFQYRNFLIHLNQPLLQDRLKLVFRSQL